MQFLIFLSFQVCLDGMILPLTAQDLKSDKLFLTSQAIDFVIRSVDSNLGLKAFSLLEFEIGP